MTFVDPRLRVCGVCATVLDYVVRPGETPGFAHTAAVRLAGGDDHPPVPVAPGEVFAATFCDFCYAPDPQFLLPARDFTYSNDTDGSVGDWALCDPCAVLVDAGRWNDIVRRVVAGMFTRYGHRMTEPEIAFVKRQHRRLRDNITGGVRPGRYPSPVDGGLR